MTNNDQNYTINPKVLKELQQQYSDATGLPAVTVNSNGEPLTGFTNSTLFCSLMRSKEGFKEKCIQCSAYGGIEARKRKAPYIYQCHTGLIDFSVPVIIGGEYVCSIVSGQARLDSSGYIESVINEQSSWENEDDLNTAYQHLPTVSYKKLKASASILNRFVQNISTIDVYGVDERKNELGDFWKEETSSNVYSLINKDITYELIAQMNIENLQESKVVIKRILLDLIKGHNNIEYFRDDVEKVINYMIKVCDLKGIDSNKYRNIWPIHKHNITFNNSILYVECYLRQIFMEMIQRSISLPNRHISVILNYIEINYLTGVSLNETANFVHLNPQYVSRLFKKKMKKTFIEYVTDRRIKHAKELLRNTNLSVLDISMKLSFQEQTYFCKVFKLRVGMTPSEYRNLNRLKNDYKQIKESKPLFI